MFKTAIIGASGYIGGHLWRSYRQHFSDCVGTSFSKPGPGLTPFDLRRPDMASLALEQSGHEAVLISSAKPNIAFCETQRQAAYEINVLGTLECVRQIARTSLSVIFLSTDYVFQGDRGEYDDGANTKPTTEYGRQKAIVEREIPSLTKNFLIVRLSKVYGLEKNDRTLLDELACSLAAGREVQAAADQFFCPTYVGDIVRAIHACQDIALRGVINVCSPESWSRFDIACTMARAMYVEESQVKKIRLHDIPSMEGRPLNTTMRCSRLQDRLHLPFTPLQQCIQQVATSWKVA